MTCILDSKHIHKWKYTFNVFFFLFSILYLPYKGLRFKKKKKQNLYTKSLIHTLVHCFFSHLAVMPLIAFTTSVISRLLSVWDKFHPVNELYSGPRRWSWSSSALNVKSSSSSDNKLGMIFPATVFKIPVLPNIKRRRVNKADRDTLVWDIWAKQKKVLRGNTPYYEESRITSLFCIFSFFTCVYFWPMHMQTSKRKNTIIPILMLKQHKAMMSGCHLSSLISHITYIWHAEGIHRVITLRPQLKVISIRGARFPLLLWMH